MHDTLFPVRAADDIARPCLLPLAHSDFRQRFEHKGRFAQAVAHVPTLAVVHPEPGLLGVAGLARLARATIG